MASGNNKFSQAQSPLSNRAVDPAAPQSMSASRLLLRLSLPTDYVEKLTSSGERTNLTEYLPSTATLCKQRLQFGL